MRVLYHILIFRSFWQETEYNVAAYGSKKSHIPPVFAGCLSCCISQYYWTPDGKNNNDQTYSCLIALGIMRAQFKAPLKPRTITALS